jgi:hypothetical protein
MKCQTIAILILLTISTVFAADTNWFEGESPSQNPMNAVPASAQHSEYISEGQWLSLNISEADVVKKVPAEGALIDYNFEAKPPVKKPSKQHASGF